MTRPPDLADAALSLVGTPFRLHGRHPATGLDCVGLVAVALERSGQPAPAVSGYCLRNRSIARWLRVAASAGLAPVDGPVQAGDVLLVAPGPWQHHLLVAGHGGDFIHADVALGRVVAMPGPLSWPVVRHWRLAAKG